MIQLTPHGNLLPLHHFTHPLLAVLLTPLVPFPSKLRPLRPMSFLKLKPNPKSPSISDLKEEDEKKREWRVDLGTGSEVVYYPRLIGYEESWKWFEYLDSQIPWTRPTIRVFGRSVLQPRDTCYVASMGLRELVYSGYKPHAYSWDDYPQLKELLQIVQQALPGSTFNSLLLNRYKGGNDHVAWHSDDETLYGDTPEIASVSFGCEREFLLKKKPSGGPQDKGSKEAPASKRLKRSDSNDQHSFVLKHGSLLVMRGYSQRDWMHSVPKRVKADSVRINLTFRHVIQ